MIGLAVMCSSAMYIDPSTRDFLIITLESMISSLAKFQDQLDTNSAPSGLWDVKTPTNAIYQVTVSTASANSKVEPKRTKQMQNSKASLGTCFDLASNIGAVEKDVSYGGNSLIAFSESARVMGPLLIAPGVHDDHLAATSSMAKYFLGQGIVPAKEEDKGGTLSHISNTINYWCDRNVIANRSVVAGTSYTSFVCSTVQSPIIQDKGGTALLRKVPMLASYGAFEHPQTASTDVAFAAPTDCYQVPYDYLGNSRMQQSSRETMKAIYLICLFPTKKKKLQDMSIFRVFLCSPILVCCLMYPLRRNIIDPGILVRIFKMSFNTKMTTTIVQLQDLVQIEQLPADMHEVGTSFNDELTLANVLDKEGVFDPASAIVIHSDAPSASTSSSTVLTHKVCPTKVSLGVHKYFINSTTTTPYIRVLESFYDHIMEGGTVAGVRYKAFHWSPRGGYKIAYCYIAVGCWQVIFCVS